jgi:hypothetical protein
VHKVDWIEGAAQDSESQFQHSQTGSRRET